MAEDATYQTLVYHERPGDAEVVKSDGILRGHSGGIMSAESGFIFTLASQDILAKDITRVVYSRNDPYTTIGAAAVSTVLSEVNLPKNTKFVLISGTSTLLKGSFWLTSCSAGAEVYLRFGGSENTTASCQIDVSMSGCILLGGADGNELSGFSAYISNSMAMVHLIAFADNVWSIVDSYGDVNEQAA